VMYEASFTCCTFIFRLFGFVQVGKDIVLLSLVIVVEYHLIVITLLLEHHYFIVGLSVDHQLCYR
jgi:hypothetical protein